MVNGYEVLEVPCETEPRTALKSAQILLVYLQGCPETFSKKNLKYIEGAELLLNKVLKDTMQ